MATRPSLRRLLLLGAALGAVALMSAAPASARQAHVLRVGTYHGVHGQFGTIQSAVDHARSGDWVLVAPGDYHERGDRVHRAKGERPPSGVLITHCRHPRARHGPQRRRRRRDQAGLDALQLTRQRAGLRPCTPRAAPSAATAIVVWKVDGVSVENLTVCNFLTGTGTRGNEIWWNGGDGSGRSAWTRSGAAT